MRLNQIINNAAHWPLVATCLGAKCIPGPWPQRAPCPLCRQGYMDIHLDPVAGGEWHHCRSCSSAGNLIELAARVWKTDVPGALRQLEDRGLRFGDRRLSDGEINYYCREHVERRNRVARYAQTPTSDFIPQSSEAIRLARTLGLTWATAGRVRRMGRFIRESHAVELSGLLRPHVHRVAE